MIGTTGYDCLITVNPAQIRAIRERWHRRPRPPCGYGESVLADIEKPRLRPQYVVAETTERIEKSEGHDPR